MYHEPKAGMFVTDNCRSNFVAMTYDFEPGYYTVFGWDDIVGESLDLAFAVAASHACNPMVLSGDLDQEGLIQPIMGADIKRRVVPANRPHVIVAPGSNWVGLGVDALIELASYGESPYGKH
jgi:hypothetical protein